uniref:Integrase catalytic domain-containing protein n=1 Tax=Peronospora matthiolae TaxID=2874970 RepID=A0AAV1US51_9STRA
MARWLSFFAEYNFTVEYKPGRLNVVADALSRRPDFEPVVKPNSETVPVAVMTSSVPSTTLYDDVRRAYAQDAVSGDTPRVVIPDDTDLRLRIMFEYHDAPTGGHHGREKTYLTVSRDCYWPRQYQFVRKCVRACEFCQRVKSSPSLRAPLQPLPVPAECWESISMDFVFGLPKDARKNTGILVFVDRFSKMVHLVAVPETITASGCACVFIDTIFRLHGLPRELVSDRDPRFTAYFWRSVFKSLGTRLKMSTSDHPESDGQTERANRVLEEILRGYVHSFKSWSEFLPMVEFAINNSVHASTTHTPFYVTGLRHPRVPTLLECNSVLRGETRASKNRFGSRSSRSDEEVIAFDADVDNIDIEEDDASESEEALTEEKIDVAALHSQRTEANESSDEFILARETVVRFVQDSVAEAVDKQKQNADKNGRANTILFNKGDLVLLSTVNLPKHVVTNLGSSKLLPKYIGPFRVLHRLGNAYTIELPRKMRTHPTFYVGRLKPYHQYAASSDEERPCAPASRREPCAPDGGRRQGSEEQLSQPETDQQSHELPLARHEEMSEISRSQAELRQTQLDASRQRPPFGDACPAHVRDRRVTLALRDQGGSRGHTLPHDNLEKVFPPPPPPLEDSRGGQRYLVEQLLNHRDVNGRRTSYLVRWRGYPPSWDSWEPRSQLMIDVLGLVEQYDAAHPVPQKERRRKSSQRGRKGISDCLSLRTSQ